jgi:hypothetical protein
MYLGIHASFKKSQTNKPKTAHHAALMMPYKNHPPPHPTPTHLIQHQPTS